MEPLTLIQFLADMMPDDYSAAVIAFETAEGRVYYKWWGSGLKALGLLALAQSEIITDVSASDDDDEAEEF